MDDGELDVRQHLLGQGVGRIVGTSAAEIGEALRAQKNTDARRARSAEEAVNLLGGECRELIDHDQAAQIPVVQIGGQRHQVDHQGGAEELRRGGVAVSVDVHAAQTHVGALARFLVEDKNLARVGPFAIRPIPIPLGAKQAERLLRISGALAVVRGSGDAVGDSSRWEWWACFKDQRPELLITKYEFSTRFNNSRRPLHKRFAGIAPATVEAHDIEGDLQLSSFVATEIAVGHFQAVAKTICALGSERVYERALKDQPAKPYSLMLPDPTDPDVGRSLQGRIAIMEARTELGQGRDHMEVLGRLQGLVREGLGNSSFGVWLQSQWFSATVEGWVQMPEALEAGEEVLDRFPESAAVVANAAALAIQMEDLQRGTELVQRIESLDLSDPSIPRLQANMA